MGEQVKPGAPAEEKAMGNSVDEKAVQSAEIVGSWVPYGVTSFVELDNAQDAQVQAQTVDMLGNQFLSMAHNIFRDEEVVDKAAAIGVVVGELGERLEEVTGGGNPRHEMDGKETDDDTAMKESEYLSRPFSEIVADYYELVDKGLVEL
jgi:hypothetical protein